MVRRAAERQIMDFPFSPYNNATDPNDIIWRLDTEEYAILLGGGAADGGGDSTKNLVRYLNLSGANLTTDFNRTYVVYEATYPSVYSLPSIIVASIFAIILMIFVVVGNLLVIVAIVTEKALKNIQNWFIASLAVADFFLGVVVIPFSLANELMGYWVFGSMWCDIHSAIDVLLCTASIMNLCLISLDRYWSITKAVEYLKQRTSFRAGVMITLVWILSAVICIPPLLGWKVKRPPELYPKCEVSAFSNSSSCNILLVILKTRKIPTTL